MTVVLKTSTIVLGIRTMKNNNLSDTLFGKTRKTLFTLFFTNEDTEFYLRQISTMTGVSPGALQIELRKLERSGILAKTKKGKQHYYRVNKSCPIFSELKSIVTKTILSHDMIAQALVSISHKIKVGFIFGSAAKGKLKSGSDIDLMIIGEVTTSEVLEVCEDVQEKLNMEINPCIYPLNEYVKKLKKGNHFLNSLLKEEKIFIIGTENEFNRLVK